MSFLAYNKLSCQQQVFLLSKLPNKEKKMRPITSTGVLLLSLLTLASCSSNKVPVQNLPEPDNHLPIWGDGAERKQEYMDVTRVDPEQPSALGMVYYSPNPPNGDVIDTPTFAQGRISFAIYDKNGHKIPVIQSGGNYYIKGIIGQRYTVFFQNISNKGYEVLVTADGIDSTTGSEGKYSDAGYILFPGSAMTIRGFRQTRSDYKPFFFNEADSPYIKDAYQGSAANIGVIGFAMFELRTPKVNLPAKPKAFPGQTNMFRLDK